MPPSSLFSPSPAARDNIWWLFCHFSAFSPEFCLPDKAMIFNRGLIEPSHVLLCPTQLAHRQPHRGCAFICLGLTKRKHFDKRRENKGERLTKRKEAASVCLPSDVCDESSESVSWALSWRERATQLFAKVIAVLAQINQASLYKKKSKRSGKYLCLHHLVNEDGKIYQTACDPHPCQHVHPDDQEWDDSQWRESRLLLIPHQPCPAPLPCHHNNTIMGVLVVVIITNSL